MGAFVSVRHGVGRNLCARLAWMKGILMRPRPLVPHLFVTMMFIGSLSLAMASDFTFLKPTPLSAVCQTFSQIGGFNVVLCDGNEREIRFRVSDVTPLDALRLVALSHGLRISATQTSGSHKTYVVGTTEQLQSFRDDLQTQVIRLRFTAVNDLCGAIVDLAKKYEVSVESMGSKNTLILQGTRADLDRIVPLVGYLDVPVASVSLDVVIRRGDRFLWRSTLQTESGRTVQAIFSQPRDPEESGDSGQELPGDDVSTSLRLDLNPTVNEDGYVDLDAQISLGPGRDTEPNPTLFLQKVETRTQFKAGEPHEIARFHADSDEPTVFILTAIVHDAPAMATLEPAGISEDTSPADEIEIEDPDSVDGTGSLDLDAPDVPHVSDEPDELGNIDIDLPGGGVDGQDDINAELEGLDDLRDLDL